jgi:malonyl-CoA O-methyltransferase
MSEPDFYVNKPLSRRAFENAAKKYDEAAILQKEVAMRLVERLEYMLIKPLTILDAGVGPGYCALDLVQRYPTAQVIALDIATNSLLQHVSCEIQGYHLRCWVAVNKI